MKSVEMPVENPYGRRDAVLEEAFRQATDNSIVVPNTLQRALFPRLSTQDTGILLQTGPGAGRLEAVFVPVMTLHGNDDQLHRLYIIASDNSVLDDYVYRLSSYARALTAARGVSITLFVDDFAPICRTYHADGSVEDNACNHPLDARVDLVVAHFSSFRSLFFGAGGVHALPGKWEVEDESGLQFELKRRDLFYFDDAQSHVRDEFIGFVKLVEFLYAEDLDVVVGATTLPQSYQEDLSFLESLFVEDAHYQPPRTIIQIPVDEQDEAETIVNLVKQRYFESSRVGVVRESGAEADAMFDSLVPLYPQLVFKYHSGQSRADRLMVYSQIRELEKEGEGYLLVTDGTAIESADIDVNLLITGLCSPESLLRRVGRCNRRGDLPKGDIVVVGRNYHGRNLHETRLRSYCDALSAHTKPAEFRPDDFKEYIA